MLDSILDVLFGCPHSNYTFPRTPRGKKSGVASLTGTYVCCLDCGKEFPYDWGKMERLGIPSQQPTAVQEEPAIAG